MEKVKNFLFLKNQFFDNLNCFTRFSDNLPVKLYNQKKKETFPINLKIKCKIYETRQHV